MFIDKRFDRDNIIFIEKKLNPIPNYDFLIGSLARNFYTYIR